MAPTAPTRPLDRLRVLRLAHALGTGLGPSPADTVAAVAAVVQLQKNLQVPYRLRDIGVPQAALKPIALKTMGERGLYFNPRVVTKVEEMEELLAHAY